MPSFTVRIATTDDASQIALLLTALGHETPIEQVAAMWQSWTLDGNRAYVADTPSGKLVGIVTTIWAMLERAYDWPSAYRSADADVQDRAAVARPAVLISFDLSCFFAHFRARRFG